MHVDARKGMLYNARQGITSGKALLLLRGHGIFMDIVTSCLTDCNVWDVRPSKG